MSLDRLGRWIFCLGPSWVPRSSLVSIGAVFTCAGIAVVLRGSAPVYQSAAADAPLLCCSGHTPWATHVGS